MAALGLLSAALAAWSGALWPGEGRSPLSPVTLALLLGLALGNLTTLPARFEAGVRFAAVRLLRLGVVLLGFQLSLTEVARLGVVALPVVALAIVVALGVGLALARALKLPAALGVLVAVGTSICGVSAVAALGPAIRARREEIAYAVAIVTLLGLIATVGYPLVVPALLQGAVPMGVFLGVSIHDTSQVTAAALMLSQWQGLPEVLDAAVVSKLLRNTAMALVLPLAALSFARSTSGVSLRAAFPGFLLGFLLLAALRTLGDGALERGLEPAGLSAATWVALQEGLSLGSRALLVLALAALGLNTRLRELRSLGLRPLWVGALTALAVALSALLAVRLWLVG